MSLHKLSPVAQKFVLHWGEMGTRWGINRTVAQVHALLFLAEKPLPAEEIADTLGMSSRGNGRSARSIQPFTYCAVASLKSETPKLLSTRASGFPIYSVFWNWEPTLSIE